MEEPDMARAEDLQPGVHRRLELIPVRAVDDRGLMNCRP
jgi:hypothetical protein